jgi:hypothetical protein
LDAIQLFGRTDCCQDRDNSLSLTLRNAGGAVLFTTLTGIPDNGQQITVPVPEPSGLALLGIGLMSLAAMRRRR